MGLSTRISAFQSPLGWHSPLRTLWNCLRVQRLPLICESKLAAAACRNVAPKQLSELARFVITSLDFDLPCFCLDLRSFFDTAAEAANGENGERPSTPEPQRIETEKEREARRERRRQRRAKKEAEEAQGKSPRKDSVSTTTDTSEKDAKGALRTSSTISRVAPPKALPPIPEGDCLLALCTVFNASQAQTRPALPPHRPSWGLSRSHAFRKSKQPAPTLTTSPRRTQQ